jgi:hypothetical protein
MPSHALRVQEDLASADVARGTGAAEPRSDQRHVGETPDNVPGAELPWFVYASAAAGYAWTMIAAWIAFGRGGESLFALSVATVLICVFLALPLLIYATAVRHLGYPRRREGRFLASPMDTATGELPAAEAWLQIVLIPAALGVAATAIGAVRVLVG